MCVPDQKGKLSELPKVAQTWNSTEIIIPRVRKWISPTNPRYAQLCIKHNLWHEDDQLDEREKAIRAIMHNKGALVSGAAGTGKTRGVLDKLRDRLRKRGESVYVCAYTHAAARLVGGMTIKRLLNFDARLHGAWILVDEWSLIPIDTLGQLACMQLVNAKFVLFGDHQGQFGPMQDRWDVPYSKVPSSDLLKFMCRSLSITLTEYVRGDDIDLFKFYHKLYKTKDTLKESIDKARVAYPVRVQSPFEFDIVLCVSHANRMMCNARMNQAKAYEADAAGKRPYEIRW